MSMLSRRDFVTSVAGVPLAAAAGSIRLDAASVPIGVTTASFRSLPRVEGRDNLEEIIRALKTVRASSVELALANLEPAPPGASPFMGGSAAYPQRVVLTPEQIMATNTRARSALRTWRLHTDPASFATARQLLANALITVHACATAFDESCTDDEIDAIFRQVKALGVGIVGSPVTPVMARRLAPFAERHGVSVAIHNHADPADLKAAFALSPVFKAALDIGNLTAANCDAVEELRECRSRVAYVIVKDRLRNGGASQVFGEGDTPIKSVLNALRAAASPVPALVEYDYVGLRSTTDEVAACLKYAAG